MSHGYGSYIIVNGFISHKLLHCIASQYITVYYSTLQYITLQYFTVHYNILLYITVYYSTIQYITVYYSTLKYITVHYSILQYITVYYSTLQYITVYYIAINYIALHCTISFCICTICLCIWLYDRVYVQFVTYKSCLDDQIMKPVFVVILVKIIHNLLSLSLSKKKPVIDFIVKLCVICNKFKTKYLNLKQVKPLPGEIINFVDGSTFTNTIICNNEILHIIPLIDAIAMEI